MSLYLMRFSYTPETWSRLIQNPEDRRDAARAYIEQVGGALVRRSPLGRFRTAPAPDAPARAAPVTTPIRARRLASEGVRRWRRA